MQYTEVFLGKTAFKYFSFKFWHNMNKYTLKKIKTL